MQTLTDVRTPPDLTAELHSELLISILPNSSVRWRGTRAQLEAQGLIPRVVLRGEFEWPTMRHTVYWKDEQGRRCSVIRAKPPGAKGWADRRDSVDYWLLVQNPPGAPRELDEPFLGPEDWRLRDAEKQLRRAQRLASPDARRHAEAIFHASLAAKKDFKFQAFLIHAGAKRPSLVRKSRSQTSP